MGLVAYNSDMESLSWYDALAALQWQIELGADEAIMDAPIDRFQLPLKEPKPARVSRKTPDNARRNTQKQGVEDAVAAANALASQCEDLAALREAMDRYDHCSLKQGARQLVFCDGVAGAPLMIIGEAPGREEDIQGRPFVGPAGRLLDRMLAAIDMQREKNVYITNVIPWRPPQNRNPLPEEIAMMRPFLIRHVELAQPRLLVVMGNIALEAVLNQKGILRLRGNWQQAFEIPTMPMVHPAYLLRNPQAKREAWADLQAIRARLQEPT